jgi:hypothetical protein
MEPHPGISNCEWKGVAQYWGLRDRSRLPQAIGWSYPSPTPPFEAIAGFFSFYPALVACFVDGEPVRPQPGEFYGGWITSEIVGPFQGQCRQLALVVASGDPWRNFFWLISERCLPGWLEEGVLSMNVTTDGFPV